MVTSGKMGIYEGMDAATGKYIFSKDLGIQNVVSSIDPQTGEKTINPEVVVGDGKPHTICPHPGGGRNWIAGSYNAEIENRLRPDGRILHGPDPCARRRARQSFLGRELVHPPAPG